MPRLDPAVAAVRLAVRQCLAHADGGRVLVACSGGPDSTALLAATVFESRRAGVRVVGATVDHGLRDGSAERAATVERRMAGIGADETACVGVQVDVGPRGVEAGAREARHAALRELAGRHGAGLVLLGHTRDDQAETVLLGLTQGSGGRSVAGMRRAVDEPGGVRVERPLLGLTRAQTRQACAAEGLEVWDDPQNADRRFRRARVRHVVLPTLERELGPGIAAALARTGEMLRDDLDALDALGADALAGRDFAAGEQVGGIAALPRAVRTRVLRRAALDAGCPARELAHGHVEALEALVLRARGEPRAVDLPGPVRAVREKDVLRLQPTAAGPPGGTA